MKETFDFVIVGSGGGSMCAALVMRAAGKSVLILEKTDLLGGTTAISGGVMWIPDNRFMKSEGIQDNAELAITYLDTIIGDQEETPGASRGRRRTYVDQASKMVDFLVEQGIRLRRIPSWPDYHGVPGESEPGRTVVSQLFDLNQLGDWKAKLRPGFLPLAANLDEAMEFPNMKRSGKAKKILARVIWRTIFGRLRGKHLVTAGQALQAQMLHAALNADVDIRINAGVEQLLVEDGKVTGVSIKKQGQEWQIGARLGVLINAGGFSRNQRMLDQYIPGTSAQWTSTAPGDTGEMIEEAIRIGGAIAQMDERIGNPIALPPGENPPRPVIVHGDMAKPHSIVVDQAGVRYMRESNSYVEVGKAMLQHNNASPAVPSWLVMDSQYLNTYMLAGTMPGKKKPKAWHEENFLHQGNTVEELATACSMDPSTLKASVERFNGFVRNGRDEDFQRGDHTYDRWLGDRLNETSPTLGAIEEGPFFAIPVYPGDVSTFGGLVTDVNARVLREDGSVIPGLYATGTSTASVMAKTSPGAGASIGPSFTWGFVAAVHAVRCATDDSKNT
ncbi:MAG: FAD-binding protein [Halioglobus sp.]|nr:FAD-binding protein [Halioglobus sp.]